MRKKRIPEVLVRSVMSLNEGAKTRIRVDSELSEEFEWRCTKDLWCHRFLYQLLEKELLMDFQDTVFLPTRAVFFHHISKNGTVYKSYVRPAILHVSEEWCLKESKIEIL